MTKKLFKILANLSFLPLLQPSTSSINNSQTKITSINLDEDQLGKTPSFRLGEKSWESAKLNSIPVSIAGQQNTWNFDVSVLKDFYNVMFSITTMSALQMAINENGGNPISFREALAKKCVNNDLKFGFGKYKNSSKKEVQFGTYTVNDKSGHYLFDDYISETINTVAVQAEDINNPIKFSWATGYHKYTLKNATSVNLRSVLTYELVFEDTTKNYNLFDILQIGLLKSEGTNSNVIQLGFNKNVNFSFKLSNSFESRSASPDGKHPTYREDKLFATDNETSLKEVIDNGFDYKFEDKTALPEGSGLMNTKFNLPTEEFSYFKNNPSQESYDIFLDEKHFSAFLVDGTELKDSYNIYLYLTTIYRQIKFTPLGSVKEPKFKVLKGDDGKQKVAIQVYNTTDKSISLLQSVEICSSTDQTIITGFMYQTYSN